MGERGVEISKEPNFIITIRYKIPTFSSVGPFLEGGLRGSRKFRPDAEILGIFSIEVTPYQIVFVTIKDLYIGAELYLLEAPQGCCCH